MGIVESGRKLKQAVNVALNPGKRLLTQEEIESVINSKSDMLVPFLNAINNFEKGAKEYFKPENGSRLVRVRNVINALISACDQLEKNNNLNVSDAKKYFKPAFEEMYEVCNKEVSDWGLLFERVFILAAQVPTKLGEMLREFFKPFMKLYGEFEKKKKNKDPERFKWFKESFRKARRGSMSNQGGGMCTIEKYNYTMVFDKVPDFRVHWHKSRLEKLTVAQLDGTSSNAYAQCQDSINDFEIFIRNYNSNVPEGLLNKSCFKIAKEFFSKIQKVK